MEKGEEVVPESIEGKAMKGLQGIIKVWKNEVHSVALQADGSLWAWSSLLFDPARRGLGTEPVLIAHLPMGEATDAAPSPGAIPVPSRDCVEFGRQEQGTRSEVQVLQITNLGTAPLVINRVRIIGDAPEDFRILCASYAGVEIYPGSGCSIRLQFSPTGPGRRRAALWIESNGLGGSQRVELSGFAPAAELICADDGEAWLRWQEQVTLPVSFRVTARAMEPAVSELDPSGTDGSSRCFLVEVPVLLQVVAKTGCSEEPLLAERRFTVSEWICVEASGLGAASHHITVLQRLRLALPVSIDAELDWRAVGNQFT